MSTKKTNKELALENRLMKRNHYSTSIASVFNAALKYGAMIAICYIFYLCVKEMAGKTTFADIGVKVFANVKISEFAAWALATGGGGYGILQRKIHKDTVARLQPRIQELEKKIDTRRSTSKLTNRGNTRPGD